MPEKIVLLIGLPGSGKSTYAKKLKAPVLSSDAIRLLLADDERDQSIHARVFATLRYLLTQRLEIHRPITYIDATHLTRAERRPYPKRMHHLNKETSRADVSDISGQYGGPPFHFQLTSEFPAQEMTTLGFRGHFFQRLGGHIFPQRRMLCSEWRSVKFRIVAVGMCMLL